MHNLRKNIFELPPELCDVHVNLLHEAEGRLYVPFRHEYVGHLVLELLVHMRLGELEHEVPLLRRRLKKFTRWLLPFCTILSLTEDSFIHSNQPFVCLFGRTDMSKKGQG